MSPDLAAFYTSIKAIGIELNAFSKCEGSRHTLDPAVFQKFLYNSINYVSAQSAPSAESSQVALVDWFSVLSQVILVLLQHHCDWDSKCITPKNLISYLSNISYKLLSVQQVPLEWHRSIWVAVLQIMALCLQQLSPGPEFIASVAQMGYKTLRCAGQKAEAKCKLDKSVIVSPCYELYILGAVIATLDPTGKSGDGLKLTKDFLSTYLRFYKYRASSVNVMPSVCEQRMLNMAIIVYTSQPRDIAANDSLTFYVQLFRLVLEDPLLCEKLLACSGDLFKYVPNEDTDNFPIDVTQAIRHNCSTTSVVMDGKPNASSVQGIVLAVLTFVHEIRQDSGQENDYLLGPMKNFHAALTSMFNMLKETAGPVSTAISDCLVVYIHSVSKLKHVRAEFLAVYVRFNSLSVQVFVRDFLSCLSRQNQAELVTQRLQMLGLVISTNTTLLETHLTRDKLGDDKVKEFAEMLKSSLKSLHCLVEAASKKKDLYPDLYEHSFTILRRAMSDVGTLGRKLTRQGLYSMTIALLAPLWPVTRMEELLPTISHHGALCESYWKTSKLKEAWSVIHKSVNIDVSLVSESVINTLVKILKQETSVSVLKLLESCQDPIRQAQLMISVVRKLILSQSLPALRHTIIILQCLVQHQALSDAQRASHQLLLAQSLWLEAEDKVSVSGQCLQLLVKAVNSLQADTSHHFDDVLAQAAFLYWAVVSATSHDTPGQLVQVKTELLIEKATACLMVWTEWFSSVGDKLQDADGTFRLETSLKFLQKVGELAVINHKTMTAVTALCQAYQLGNLMKRSDVVEDVARALISIIPLLGLQLTSVGEHGDIRSDKFLIEGLKLGQSGDLLSLTAAATYHLRVGQLDKYICARNHASKIIDDLRQQGLRSPNIYTSLAILSRLDAEFHSLPNSNKPKVQVDPTPNPLELVGESLKYIKNVVTFHLGENPQNSKNKSSPLEIWPVVHEYLTSLRLYGDLCLHVGSAKYAKTYFTEGLLMAQKFLLVVWSAVFSACLLKVSLICQDTTSEAEDLLQSTVILLKKHCLAIDKNEPDDPSKKNLTEAVTSQQLSRMFAPKGAVTSEMPCPCCPVTGYEDGSVRAQLLFETPMEQEKIELEESDHKWKILSLAERCGRCFQPEIADLCAGLMCAQAEILWRSRQPQCLVTSSFQAALKSAECLAWVSPQKCVEDILNASGMTLDLCVQGNNMECSTLLCAAYQLAEMTFQSLYVRDEGKSPDCSHDEATILEVHNLLDIVEREGRKMERCMTSNVVVASALLLKSHLNYLPLLHTVEEAAVEVACDRAAIVTALEAIDKKKTKSYQRQGNTSSVVTSPAVEEKQAAVYCLDQGRNKATAAAASNHKARHSSSSTLPTCQKTLVKQARLVLSERSPQQIPTNITSPCASFSKSKHSRLAGCLDGRTKLRKLRQQEHNCREGDSQRSPLLVLHQNQELLCEQKKPRSRKCETSHRNLEQVVAGHNVEDSSERTAMYGTVSQGTVIDMNECGKIMEAVKRKVKRQETNGERDDLIMPETGTKNRRICRNEKKNLITKVTSKKTRLVKRNVDVAEILRADDNFDVSCVSSNDISLESISTGSSRNFWGSFDRDEASASEFMSGNLSSVASVVSQLCDVDHFQAEMLDQVRADPSTPKIMSIDWDCDLQLSVEIPRGRLQRKMTEINDEPEAGRATRGRPKGKTVSKSQVQGTEFRVHVDIEEKENLVLKVDDGTETLSQKVLQLRFQQGNGQQSSSTPILNRTTRRLQDLFSPNIASRTDILTASTRQRAPRKGAGKRVVKAVETAAGEKDNVSLASCQPENSISRVKVDVTGVNMEERTSIAADLQATKFPILNLCQPVTARMKYLQDALQQLDQFAPSVLHRQISQSLALCLWEQEMTMGKHSSKTSSQPEIAAYLTDSMHATFQHQMAKNLHYKLRKAQNHDSSGLSCEQAEIEALKAVLPSLTFGGDVMKRFTDRMTSLPSDWTVGHVTIVGLDPCNPGQGQIFVTRLTSSLEPITVGLPCDRWPALQRCLRLYELAIEHKTDHACLKQHWQHRHQQDLDMQNLVHYLQEVFLSGHKWLLRGQLSSVKQLAFKEFLNKAAQETVDSVLQLFGYHLCHGTIRNMMEVLLEAPEKDIIALVGSIWPTGVVQTVAEAVMKVQQTMMGLCRNTRGPVILVLDKTLNKIPWESMPDLSQDTITRVPSLSSLHVMLTLHNAKTRSPFITGVDRTSAVAVIPPDTDLQNAVSHLAPQFQQYPGWKCLIQKAPTVSELKCFLTDSSLYLYCGHNWGHQYVGGRDVQLFHARSTAILMGCGSGRLEHRRRLDGDGGPLYFLLAGCPTVVGNLWLVTDKDIDKLTSCLFSQWMAQSGPVSLSQLLSIARKACKLIGLTGFAPVIYGLPVMMN